MGKFELSLSANYVRDWTIVDAVREFLQNAIDQEATQEDNTMFFDYNADAQVLSIGNKKSVLSARSLLLGASTKSDDEDTVGQFGEGYKIATLVAIRAGKKVIFYNYGNKEIWKPRMVKSRRYEGAEVLTFFTEKALWKQPPNHNLTITIDGISAEEYQLIKASSLRLQDDIGEVLETSKGRILCDPRFKGQLFVNGLFVRTEPKMTSGYDFKAKYLKLDRDRKMVSTFELTWMTSLMWGETVDARVIEVAKSGAPDARYLGSTSYEVSDETKKQAQEAFEKEHGALAIPVSNAMELEHTQDKYTDAKAVLVPEAFQKLIVGASSYTVKAKERTVITVEDQLLIWLGKVQDRITAEERAEFIDIIGKEW